MLENLPPACSLHGVGISVVNALSDRVEVTVRRDGQVYDIAFERGDKVSDLTITGTCGRRNTGTRVRFWPEARYFDSPRFSVYMPGRRRTGSRPLRTSMASALY